MFQPPVYAVRLAKGSLRRVLCEAKTRELFGGGAASASDLLHTATIPVACSSARIQGRRLLSAGVPTNLDHKTRRKKILYLLLLSKFRSPKERAGPETPDKTRLPRNEPCETEAPARTRSRTKHAAPANEEEEEEAGAIPANGNAGRPLRLPGFLFKRGTMIRRYGWEFPQEPGGSIQAGALRGSLSPAPWGIFTSYVPSRPPRPVSVLAPMWECGNGEGRRRRERRVGRPPTCWRTSKTAMPKIASQVGFLRALDFEACSGQPAIGP